MKGGEHLKDALTLANINLYAVLRNIEELCDLDDEMHNLIKGKDISIQFVVRGGPEAVLKFKDNKCTFIKGRDKCNIKLFFKSPSHFNAMVSGDSNPIPLKGFSKLKFLTNDFISITDRLTHYLTPTDELLMDSNYFHINTVLTAYTAIFALAEIGNTDRIGRLNASRIPDGLIQVMIKEGPAISIDAKSGHLTATKGHVESPRAWMIFDSIQTANEMLNGKIDSYSCISTGKLEMKGFIPMLDNTDKLLGQVSKYLK